MDPVAIFQHSATESPGYFATFLDSHSIPWRLIRIDQGAAVPESTDGFSGLCFMGGVMSVNDDLPWIAPVLALIRQAVVRDIPVIGHCLGGQLMAKALGGVVTRNPTKVIGWWDVTATESSTAREWFGSDRCFEVFHWHGDTFSIPPGAEHVLTGVYCATQAFVMGAHVGMQCHIEMTEEMVRAWNENWEEEVGDPDNPSPSAQSPAEQLRRMKESLPRMRDIARHVYARWIAGLRVDRREIADSET